MPPNACATLLQAAQQFSVSFANPDLKMDCIDEVLAKFVYRIKFHVPILRKPSSSRNRFVPVRVQMLTMLDFASPSRDLKSGKNEQVQWEGDSLKFLSCEGVPAKRVGWVPVGMSQSPLVH